MGAFAPIGPGVRLPSSLDSGPLGHAVTNLGKNLVRESAKQLRAEGVR